MNTSRQNTDCDNCSHKRNGNTCYAELALKMMRIPNSLQPILPIPNALVAKPYNITTDCENILVYSSRKKLLNDKLNNIQDWINWLENTREGKELTSCISYLRKETLVSFNLKVWPSDKVPWVVTFTGTNSGPQINIVCVPGKLAQPQLKNYVQIVDGQRSTNLFYFLNYIIEHIKHERIQFPGELLNMLEQFYQRKIIDQRILGYVTKQRALRNPKTIYWLNLRIL
jgi:hypothetical protein